MGNNEEVIPAENKGSTLKVKRKETIPPKKKKKVFMYLGPNLPGGILFSGSSYKDTIPEHLAEVLEKHPELKKLFVEVTEVVKFKGNLNKPGTTAHALYEKVLKQREKGVYNNVL